VERRRARAGLVGIALLVAAWGTNPPPSASAPASVSSSALAVIPGPTGSTSSAPVPTPTPAIVQPTRISVPNPTTVPTPSPVPLLDVDSLPRVELADIDATGVCDPDPGLREPGAGESLIGCSDGLTRAISVVRTATSDPVTRLYLVRPRCAPTGCSRRELSTAKVYVWTASNAYRVNIDWRRDTSLPPAVAINPAWPNANAAPAPAVRRPAIKSAPAEVARRTPYPFCGRAVINDPPSVATCFRNAVLAGRPVEMIETVYGTEGGAILRIDRYDGNGRIIQYQHDQSVNGDGTAADQWLRNEGAMILLPNSFAWDFTPWLSEGLRG
jgi:hypothetical protein